MYFMVSYVTNSNSFPKPLTVEEEKYYLKEYANGVGEAKNKLIECNLRLVAHIVKKFSNSNFENDDLISIGTIGLIKAISTFDANKGTRLATYAARCIENEVLMYIRSVKKRANEVSIQEPIGTDKEGNDIALEDILPAEKDSIIDQIDFKMQTKKLYEKMKKTLIGRELKVIEMRYGLTSGKEKTQREIAELLDISRSYV